MRRAPPRQAHVVEAIPEEHQVHWEGHVAEHLVQVAVAEHLGPRKAGDEVQCPPRPRPTGPRPCAECGMDNAWWLCARCGDPICSYCTIWRRNRPWCHWCLFPEDRLGQFPEDRLGQSETPGMHWPSCDVCARRTPRSTLCPTCGMAICGRCQARGKWCMCWMQSDSAKGAKVAEHLFEGKDAAKVAEHLFGGRDGGPTCVVYAAEVDDADAATVQADLEEQQGPLPHNVGGEKNQVMTSLAGQKTVHEPFGALDSACNRTLAGHCWMFAYLSTLSKGIFCLS